MLLRLSMLCILLASLTTIAIGQEGGAKNVSIQDTVDAYPIYKNCPDGTYYADVPGMEMYCEAFPLPASKQEWCWRDFWWKTWEIDDPKRVALTNPFDTFTAAEACRSPCYCKITMDMSRFLCTEKGARLGWNRYPPPYTKYKPIFHCEEFTLPEAFQTLPTNGDVQLVVSITNFLSSSSQLRDEMEQHFNMSTTIFGLGFPIAGWMINTTSRGARSTSFDKAESFLYNISFPKDMRRLDLIHSSFDPQQPDTSTLQFPDLDLILSSLNSSLEYLKLEGFNLNTIPDRVQPRFAPSLKAITVRNTPAYAKMPAWIGVSKDLTILILDRVSSSFSWDSLAVMANVRFFAFTNTLTTSIPAKVSLAAVFPQLEYLDLSNLNMTAIRKDLLTGLGSLRYLDLSGNDLSSLPSMAGLVKLEWLGLAGVRSPTKSPTTSSTCTLGQTRRLSLSQTDLSGFPNLTTLDISNYESVNLNDDTFAKVATTLERLIASCVGWTQLPTALKSLCRLKELRLGSNRLNAPDSIPSFLPIELTDLKVLDLKINDITVLPSALLSLSKTNHELIESIRISMMGNPTNASVCETNRFEAAYGLGGEGEFRFANTTAALLADQQCSMANMTMGSEKPSGVKMCPPAPRGPFKIVISSGGGSLMRNGISFVITTAMLVVIGMGW